MFQETLVPRLNFETPVMSQESFLLYNFRKLLMPNRYTSVSYVSIFW